MRNDSVTKTLKLLAQKGPSHFDELAFGLKDSSSKLSVYVNLRRAEKKGYVKSTMMKRKNRLGIRIPLKLYELTEKGRVYLRTTWRN